MDSYSTSKGLHFHFCINVLGLNFFLLCPESVFFILNFEYLDENGTKIENILTPWSVAQAGLNDEKYKGVENIV